MTKISIVIPTYNGAVNIHKQIKTIIKDCKTGKINNFYELVISDNCSTDNTKEIVSNYKTNKFVKINYCNSRTNTGFPSNFLRSIKMATSQYIFFLTDDNLPDKEFYKKLYNFFENNDYVNLCIFPLDIVKNFKKRIFGFNELAYVLMRGSIMSGMLIEKKKINYKYIVKKGLYPQNGIFVDYYLNYGLKIFNCSEKINCYSKFSIETKFNDRMQRKKDLAVIDKINSIDVFFQNKKINYFQLFYCYYAIYFWVFNIKNNLVKAKKKELAKIFFKSTISKNRSWLIYIAILCSYMRILLKKNR